MAERRMQMALHHSTAVAASTKDECQQGMSYLEIKRLMSVGTSRVGSVVEREPRLTLKEGLTCSGR